MASPSFHAARSETDFSSSPVRPDKSFATNITSNLTEDEDDDSILRNTSRVASTSAAERHGKGSASGSGGGRGGRGRGGRESTTNGKGGSSLYKDSSAIGKIRHLKKEDGEPLWRVDIQYDFLRAIFDNDRCVFTNSYEPETVGKQCFADLYIDTMARSSKTSKILHDKLRSDREAAKNMAMVCLLVNIGRMNTTLNFFPEMRAQLRTYHAIPSLQVDESATDYKQLQDAPRLKSILKGGTEDRAEPRTLDTLKDMDLPRTNPVNLLFLICNNASKVAELHFPPGREFHDLIMRTDYSSKSRANAFLWIAWFYLESDFTEEGCEENPFGAGVDYGVDVANQGVPAMVELTPEQEALENQDTPAETEFGLARKAFRAKILSSDQLVEAPANKRNPRPSRPSAAALAVKESSVASGKDVGDAGTDNERASLPNILPRIRPSKHESDMESVRSTPPPRSLARSFGGGASDGHRSGPGNRRAGPLKGLLADGASPARQPPLLQQLYQQQQLQQSRKRRRQKNDRGHDDDDDDMGGVNTSVAPSRKPRPPTAHQIAVENNRKQRIEYLLSRGIYRKHHRSRKVRRTEGAIIRALRRLDKVDDPFEDSENEDNLLFNRSLFSFQPGAPQNMPSGTAFRERGFYGLVQLSSETDDFGEEISNYAGAMRRACRRLNRWETDGKDSLAVVPPIKRQRVNVPFEDEYRDPNETEEEQDLDPLDMDLSMSVLETTPAPAAKRRRPTGGGAASSSRARGGRATKAGGATSASRKRRSAAASKAANGDVTMDVDDVEGDADRDATALASGAEDADVDAEAADDTDAVASVTASAVPRPRVTIKKPGSSFASSSRAASKAKRSRPSQVKHEDEETEEDGEEDDDDGNEDDDELNDVDKTLLGMGEGDTDSE